MPEIATRERPIIYSAPMVRALLAAVKTQTRRVVAPEPIETAPGQWRWQNGRPWTSTNRRRVVARDRATGETIEDREYDMPFLDWIVEVCPYGRPGDRLWVRESFALSVRDPEGLPYEEDPSNWAVRYRADGDSGQWHDNIRNAAGVWTRVPIKAPWKPSIFMPRRACRLVLEITDVRAERLQAITDADIRAEGVEEYVREKGLDPARTNFRAGWIDLWDGINAGREGGKYAWDKNPWVWVVSFRREGEN